MPPKLKPLQFPFAVATISLRDSGTISNLVYFLWDKLGQTRIKKQWPFSKRHSHWLYDEIDVRRETSTQPLYVHRILLSDGRTLTVPFFDVVVQAFSETPSETTIVRKKRA